MKQIGVFFGVYNICGKKFVKGKTTFCKDFTYAVFDLLKKEKVQ
jgi:hypothetical protein